MRKNKMMRAASGILVATLMTTSIISGTFAKYTTFETASDSARVAKWGVEITANGAMFKDSYETDESTVKTTIANSVSTDGKEDVVAPGTKGDLVNATISGKPEVAVHVEYTPNLELTGWDNKDGTGKYCPIVFTVKGETYGLTGMRDSNGEEVKNQSTDIADLERAVEAAITKYSKDYAPNTDLSGINEDYVKVSWEWAFEGNDDTEDTELGNKAANGNASTVHLEIQTRVTQID